MYNPSSKTLLKQILKEIKDPIDKDFEMRLYANFSKIVGLANRLYGHRQDLQGHISNLIKRMISASAQRPQELKTIDIKREEKPQWFLSPEITGMMLYVDRFAGDLKGFQEKLPYLEELGVNLVHLMPLLKSPEINNDGGYAVSDFRTVEPRLGTMSDIKKISKKLRAKGMYLMLDLAVNHTSDEHEWAEKAKAGNQKYQDYFYIFDDRTVPDQYEASMPMVFPDTAPGNFTYLPDTDQWVMTVFHEYQWDLNYTNPEVFIEMLDNLLFLANQGVDVVRLDALAFTWKKIGTESQNLEEAHLLMQLFKACSQVVAPGALFLAEAIVAPNDIIGYFGIPDGVNNECDMAYNATLMTLLWESIVTKNNRLLNMTLNNIPGKPYGTTWLNYIRCHDDIGLGYEDTHAGWAGYNSYDHRTFIIDFLTGKIDWSFARGKDFMRKAANDARICGSLASLAGLEKAVESKDDYQIDLAAKRIILLHAIILSYGGIPMLYMGDELGMINDYSYLEHPESKDDSRWMHRPFMDWNKADKRQADSVENRIFTAISHMIAIRRESHEFADLNNTWRVEAYNEHLFAFIRGKDAYRTFCVYNLNDHPEPLSYAVVSSQGFDLYHGVRDRITDQKLDFNSGNVLLDPYQPMWISQISSFCD